MCLDLVLVLQDVKIYSGEQTVARRTRHTWECLQSFEFKYKKNLAAGNTVESTFDPLKKKKKVQHCSCIMWRNLILFLTLGLNFYLHILLCFICFFLNFCSDDVAA